MTTTTQGPDTGRAHVIARLTGALAGALDRAADAPAWSMTDEEQRTCLVGLARVQARMSELRLRVLAAADTNDIGAVNGASSTGAWVAGATRQTRAGAHADVRLSTALDGEFAATRTGLAAGAVNEEQARVIVAAVNDLPETVPELDRRRAEAHLIAEAAERDAKDLKALGRRIFEVIDPDAADAEEAERLAKDEREARRKTFLKMFDNGDGSYSGAFKLPALHAHMLKKALHALTSPRRVGPDARVNPDGTKIGTPELLGWGLIQLIERYPVNKLPKSGGLNATILVTMTLDQLRTELAAASLDTGARISAGEARRLACEAGIIPVVLGGPSQVLDVGRRRRFHSETQRVAMALRDGGCTTDTCDRPPAWTEAHHEVPWSRGGGTSLTDGRLLCTWHHHRAHDPAYDMTRMPNGQVRFNRRTQASDRPSFAPEGVQQGIRPGSGRC